MIRREVIETPDDECRADALELSDLLRGITQDQATIPVIRKIGAKLDLEGAEIIRKRNELIKILGRSAGRKREVDSVLAKYERNLSVTGLPEVIVLPNIASTPQVQEDTELTISGVVGRIDYDSGTLQLTTGNGDVDVTYAVITQQSRRQYPIATNVVEFEFPAQFIPRRR